jgi:hypothetical protein
MKNSFTFLLLFIATLGKSQIYADLESHAANGLCTGCSVISPQNAVDGNTSTNSILNLTVDTSGAYVLQNLAFSSPSGGFELAGAVVEDINLSALDNTLLSSITLTTYSNGISNNDTKTSSQYSISLLQGSTTKYKIEFMPTSTFDAIELKLNAGLPGALDTIKIYYAYYDLTVLPIQVLDFSGAVEKDKIKLKWSTASQEMNDAFVIEESDDGMNFTSRGKVVVNAASGNDHEFTCTPMQKGILYYRLKQIEAGGMIHYSEMIAIEYKPGGTEFNVLPNPSTADNINVISSGVLEEGAEIRLMSMRGKVFYSGIIPTNSAFHTLPIEETLCGLYFIEIKYKDTVVTKKILVR